MRIAIITIAGKSSRFNKDIPKEKQQHKCIYHEGDDTNTLLYHLLTKCSYADRVILVGGNQYEAVQDYCDRLPQEMRGKIDLVYNGHYEDLASGYSLYLGLTHMFETYRAIEDVLFVEGDLDIDQSSFEKVVSSKGDVLTYSYEPIFTKKAVVLYRNAKGEYHYAFNSDHGLLTIQEPFSLILNSGQMWKFANAGMLKEAMDAFYHKEKDGTNLIIIQNYIDAVGSDDFQRVGLSRWTNCNTRQDYWKIQSYWEEEENENIK
jgi:CTP:phosphocholine cytidylyltransferase-like protein